MTNFVILQNINYPEEKKKKKEREKEGVKICIVLHKEGKKDQKMGSQEDERLLLEHGLLQVLLPSLIFRFSISFYFQFLKLLEQ